MYNRKRIARGTGTAIAVWALVGLFIMSTGVVYALPLAGIGGFTITAESVEADNLLLYPGVGDTSELSAYPQTITELENPVLQDLMVTKTIDLGATPGLSGNLRVRFISQGETAGRSVLLKSSTLQADNATFREFAVVERGNSDPRQQFQIQADEDIALSGTGPTPVRIRAHYLATGSISLSNTRLAACYDPDDDGDYEYGPCSGNIPGPSPGSGSDSSLSGNVAPSAVAVANPNPVSVGERVTLDAAASYDPDGSVESYSWSFPGGSASGETASTTFGSMGDKTVRLTVTDNSGDTSTDTVTVNVGTQAPNADISASPVPTIPGSPVQFDGSGSSDPDGSITSYEWDFGDGADGFGQSPAHSYGSTGTYTVNLTVTDDMGMQTSETTDIEIIPNEPPSASASVDDAAPNPGQTVTFDASGSTDSTGDITSYEWSFGDGSTATGANPTHAYSSGGTYTATVTVTDEAGATDEASVTIDVNEAPTANATVSPASGDEDTTFTFDGSGSSDPDGSITSYEWEIEEEPAFSDVTTFTKSGETVDAQIDVGDLGSVGGSKTFTATLTVTDDDGTTATDTVEYTVENCEINIC